MAIDIEEGVRRALDVGRFIPSPQEVLRPIPTPEQGDLVAAGIAADILGYGLGLIPLVGNVLGGMVNDNIMADVQGRLTPDERAEFREQNRFYPNGIALIRTFQRIKVAPGGARK